MSWDVKNYGRNLGDTSGEIRGETSRKEIRVSSDDSPGEILLNLPQKLFLAVLLEFILEIFLKVLLDFCEFSRTHSSKRPLLWKSSRCIFLISSGVTSGFSFGNLSGVCSRNPPEVPSGNLSEVSFGNLLGILFEFLEKNLDRIPGLIPRRNSRRNPRLNSGKNH